MSALATEFVLVAATWLLLVAVTAIGPAHRGQRPLLCLLSGVLFPVTWAVWYVIDDRAPGGHGRLSRTWRWGGTHAGRPEPSSSP